MDYLIFKNRTPHEIKPFVGGYNQFFKRVELHSLCIYARLCTLKDLRIRWLGRDEISPLTSIFYVVVDGIQWCQCRIEVPCFMVQRIPRASFLTFVFFFVAGQSLYAITLLSNLIVSNQSHWLRSRFLVMKWKQAICFILGFIFIMHNWALIQL